MKKFSNDLGIKKLLLPVVTMITTVFQILVSCSSDMDVKLNEEQIGIKVSDVVQHLQGYNENLDKIPHTRGLGWAGWLSIAIADGKGAYDGAKLGGRIGAIFGPKGATAGAVVGGAIVGGAASFSQYQMAKKISESSLYALQPISDVSQQDITAGYVLSKESIVPQDYTVGLYNGLDSCSVRIAIQHNKILEKIELVQFSDNQQKLLDQLENIEREIVISKEFEIGYNKIISNSLVDSYDLSLLSDQVMKLFISAISNSCQSQNDVNKIISHYTSVVKSSNEISSEEKEWLYAGFAVMGYSFDYWSKNYPYEQ